METDTNFIFDADFVRQAHQRHSDLVDGDGNTPIGPAGIAAGDGEALPMLTKLVPVAGDSASWL